MDSEGIIEEKEVDDVFVPRDLENKVWLWLLIDFLWKYINLSASEDKHMISYFCEKMQVYVYAGIYPDL